MALEAGFFYLPMVFWGQASDVDQQTGSRIHSAQTNSKSGLNIGNVVKTVEKIDESNEDEDLRRKKAVISICQHLEDSVRLRYIRRESASQLDHWLKMRIGMLDGHYVSKYAKLLIPN